MLFRYILEKDNNMISKKLINLHENVSPDHYDKGIKKNVFQKYWHSKRIKEIIKLSVPTKGRLLDVGCHSGLLTKEIIKHVKPDDIYGIDISVRAIEKAKKRIKNGKFKVADAHKLPYENSFFNVLFCLEMLEHVDYPKVVIRELYRVLKKDGYAIILVPTDNLLFRIVWFLWNIRYSVWKHVHVQSFQNDLLERIVKKEEFKITLVKTFNFKMLKIIKIVK